MQKKKKCVCVCVCVCVFTASRYVGMYVSVCVCVLGQKPCNYQHHDHMCDRTIWTSDSHCRNCG